jgi:hypothetical protein
MPLYRGATTKDLTIANGAAFTEAFDMSTHAGGIVLMPAAWTAANIGFQVSDTETGTFYPLYDDAGAIVEIASPATDKGFSIPAEVFGAAWVKLWSQDGAGSGTNQAAERSIKVVLKS